MSSLTFSALRGANSVRVGQFKNKHGKPAHTKADGSDWTPAQWLGCIIGELGELARVRLMFEAGEITVKTYRERVRKETADVQIYLDLFAMRAFDPTTPASDGDSARGLLEVIAALGEYANDRKKFDRREYSAAEYMLIRSKQLKAARLALVGLTASDAGHTTQKVSMPDMSGFDLGVAVVEKFNEVSERVGSTVMLR